MAATLAAVSCMDASKRASEICKVISFYLPNTGYNIDRQELLMMIMLTY
jgi:hypothetical protein